MNVRGAPLRIGVLASGDGSNLQAVMDACAAGRIPCSVAAVVSNNSQAGALERARRAGIPAYHLSNAVYPDDGALDRAIVAAFAERGVELVLFAGYMKKRGAAFLRAFPNRVLNIHPALLPGGHGGAGKFGIHVHESVLAAGERVTGVTIHLVDEHYDHGPIVARYVVDVFPGDTAAALQARVLEIEHRVYPAVVGAVARGAIDLDALAEGRPTFPAAGSAATRASHDGALRFPAVDDELLRQVPAVIGPELWAFLADWDWGTWTTFIGGFPVEDEQAARKLAWLSILKTQRLQLEARRILQIEP
jgi:phosphoribosylglycinamide formyltransferase-1